MIGMAGLVEQVEAMVADAGEAAGFDARAWLEQWMTARVPALGLVRPIDLMGTAEGQALVSQVLAQIGSGAYA